MYEYILSTIYFVPIINYFTNYKNLNFLRSANRFIASYYSLVIPIFGLILNNELPSILRTLFTVQMLYYTIDMPIAIYKKDIFQIIHHVIGYGLNYFAYFYSNVAPFIILLFYLIEQGSVLLLATTLMLKHNYSIHHLYKTISLNYYLFCCVLFIRAFFYIYTLNIAYDHIKCNLKFNLEAIVLYTFLLIVMIGQYYWAYTSFLSVRKAFFKIKNKVKQ